MTAQLDPPRPIADPPAGPSPAAPGRIRPPDRMAGAAAVAAAALFTGAFALLGVTFDYPAVLDEPGGEILTRYAEAGLDTRLLWYAMVVASMAFVPVAVLLGRSIAARAPGRPALGSVTVAIGVLAGVLQAVGFARWTFAVPFLADLYTDPASTATERETAVVVLEVMHRFVGGALGEHLGFALTAAWAVGVAVLLTGAPGVPRWLPPVGIVSAAAIVTGTAEVTGATWPGLFVAGGYALFAAWLAAIGLLLLIRPSAAADGQRVPRYAGTLR